MTFIEKPSPNFDERAGSGTPDLIVIHYTGMKSLPEVIDRLRDPVAKVSAHYLIDEDGNIYRMVDETKRAWHAGVSHWQGHSDVNSRSVGIEVMNNGDKPFTKAQLTALAVLCKDIMHRHGIPPHHVIGHSDVAPDRKEDPGPFFPWHDFSKLDIGHWPIPKLRDSFNAAAAAKNDKYLTRLFNRAGYKTAVFADSKPDLKQVVTAFQSRYQPHIFHQTPARAGIADAETVTLLRALARDEKKFKKENLKKNHFKKG